MSRGKRVCEILKAVRKQIADANGIFYEPRVCTYKGDCQGTCPVCDFEVRYLERELSACRKAGGTVKIAGIVSVMSLVSCGGDMTSNNIVSNNGIQQGVEAECSEDTMSVGVDVAEKENGNVDSMSKPLMGYVYYGKCDSKTTMEEKKCVPEKKWNAELSYIGGEEALMQDVKKNLRYPLMALDNHVIGIVFVKFEVDSDGIVKNPVVVRSVDPILDQEALRVVMCLDKWKPAIENGKAISSFYTLEIKFEFPDDLCLPQRFDGLIPENKETKAEYIGGGEALYQDIEAKLVYPKTAWDNKVEGTVVLQLIIDTTGSITRKDIIKSDDPRLDEEALRVVDSLGKWTPGTNAFGEIACTYFTLPIIFKMKVDSTKTK